MDVQKKVEMLISFKTYLEADTAGQGPWARMEWLVSHLEDYLHRWTGWLAATSMEDVLQKDLHVVLMIAIDMIDEEQAILTGYDCFQEKWLDFAATFRKIDMETSKDIAEELLRKFYDARKELPQK